MCGLTLDLRAIVDRSVALGDPAGELLLAFADALLVPGQASISAAREALRAVLGDAALTGAAAVAGNFSRNDRIANGIGIRLEREFVEQGAALRRALGLDAFASARNTLE